MTDTLKAYLIAALATVYWVGHIATFGYLTFFDGFRYNWWNWIIALAINEFLSLIWPIYWIVLRPLFE